MGSREGDLLSSIVPQACGAPDTRGARLQPISPISAMTPVRDRRLTWLAIGWIAALAAVFAARLFLPQFLRVDLYADDVRQHVWWTQRFADPGLFPGDPLAAFMSRSLFDLYGWQALYRLLVPLLDAQTVAELLPFALTAVVVALGFSIGRRVSGGLLGGVIAGTFLVLSGSLRHLEGGLPRSFALPVILFGTWALLGQRHALFGASILAGTLFYPQAAINLGSLGVAALAFRIWKERRLPEAWPAAIVLALAGVAVMLLTYATPPPADVGPRITAEEARAMPEYWPGGRSKFFEKDPLKFYFTGRNSGLEIRPAALAGWLAAIAVAAFLMGNVLPFEAWALAAAALVDFVLAHALIFTLHYPSRYVRYALPVFAMMWISAVLSRVILRLWSRVGAALRPLGNPAVLAAASALVILVLSGRAAIKISREIGKVSPPGREAALAFLETLPKDTLIAAHPRDADRIPFRARRSVLASVETSLPYYAEYYRRAKERTMSELQACYATDFVDADRLHTLYGADVFLVNRRRYKERGWRSYAPLDKPASEWFELGRRGGFALLDPPPDRILFQRGDYTVIRLGPPRGPFQVTSADSPDGEHG